MGNEELILGHLLDIRADVAEIRTMLNATIEAFNKHVADDQSVEHRVSTIEDKQKKSLWFLAGVGSIVSVIWGAVLAWLNR